MRSAARIGGLAAACALFMAAPASAQSFIWVGGGPTFPMNDYGNYAKTGFLVSAGVGSNVGDQGLSFLVEGFFGQNNHSDVTGDKTNPLGAMAGLQYDFAGAGASQSLYVLGEAGLFVHKYSSDTYDGSSSKGLGLAAALGYYFPLGSVTGWVEGRVIEARIESENTMFSGVFIGISFPVGQRDNN